MSNKVILGSLAMDLRRVAVGYHRGSFAMADRFYKEAIARKQEINMTEVAPYIQILLKNLKMVATQNTDRRAEDLLMYSILFQNAAISS